MKKVISLLMAAMLIVTFGLFAMGSGDSGDSDGSGDNGGTSQDSGTVSKPTEDPNALGDYKVVIDSCRMAKDYEGKDVVIVKYIFTNVSDDDASSFMFAVSDKAYQAGIELESAIITDDAVKYDSENQMKDIKKGATLEVEVAYKLYDTTTEIEIEVSEFIGLSDKKITKKFTIA